MFSGFAMASDFDAGFCYSIGFRKIPLFFFLFSRGEFFRSGWPVGPNFSSIMKWQFRLWSSQILSKLPRKFISKKSKSQRFCFEARYWQNPSQWHGSKKIKKETATFILCSKGFPRHLPIESYFSLLGWVDFPWVPCEDHVVPFPITGIVLMMGLVV